MIKVLCMCVEQSAKGILLCILFYKGILVAHRKHSLRKQSKYRNLTCPTSVWKHWVLKNIDLIFGDDFTENNLVTHHIPSGFLYYSY